MFPAAAASRPPHLPPRPLLLLLQVSPSASLRARLSPAASQLYPCPRPLGLGSWLELIVSCPSVPQISTPKGRSNLQLAYPLPLASPVCKVFCTPWAVFLRVGGYCSMEGIAPPSKQGSLAFVRDPAWAQTFWFCLLALLLCLGYLGKFESQHTISFNQWVKNWVYGILLKALVPLFVSSCLLHTNTQAHTHTRLHVTGGRDSERISFTNGGTDHLRPKR